jgi:hypothetical protein
LSLFLSLCLSFFLSLWWFGVVALSYSRDQCYYLGNY